MKRRIVLIVIVLGFLGSVTVGVWWYVRRSSGVRLLSRAELAIRAEKYSRAVDLASRYIIQRPNDWRGHYVQAQAYIHLGRYDEARKALAEAKRLDDSQVSVHLALARTYVLPALKVLELRDVPPSVERLHEAIRQFGHARVEVLSDVKAVNEEDALDVQEAIGHNWMYVGLAQRTLGTRLTEEAEIAGAAGDEDQQKTKQQQGETALAESAESFKKMAEQLLAVVKRDRSRARAADSLVKVSMACYESGMRDFEKFLEAAQEAVTDHETPSPAAAARLAIWSLREGYADAETLTNTRRLLDGLLNKYPDEVEVRRARAFVAWILATPPESDRAELQKGKEICEGILKEHPQHREAGLIHARLLMAEGKWGQAEQELLQLKTRNPRWAEAQFAYAQAALATGKRELARQVMRTVTALDPGHAQARSYFARSLLAEGFYEQAFADAQAYYQAHPGDPLALRLYVESAWRTDRRDQALRAIVKAREDYASRPEVLMSAVAGYALLGDRSEAMEVARVAAGIKPRTTEEGMAVAQALVLLKQTAEAETILLEAAKADPKSAAVQFQLARLYAATGRSTEAISACRAAVRRDGDNIHYRLALARALFSGGLLEECHVECEEILRQEPANPAALLLAERLKIVKGELVSDVQVLQQIAAGQRAGLRSAVAHLRRGRPDKCVEICSAELKKTPKDLDVRFLLGKAHLMMGRKDKCVEEWTEMLKTAPGDLSANMFLAEVLSEDMPPDQVAARLSAIHGAQPGVVDVAIGRLYLRQGDYKRAAEISGRAAHRSDVVAGVRNLARLHRAEALAKAGDINESVAELDELAASEAWHKRALFSKASLLAATRRLDEAKAVLLELAKAAVADEDVGLLHRIAGLHVRMGQIDEALQACDQMQGILPNAARAHLLRAVVLTAAGRGAEAPEWYRKAIQAKPASASARVLLAKNLDANDEPLQALEVLNQLADLGKAARGRALFERAALLAGWGLQAQAVACLEELSELGYDDDPRLKMALGLAFARLGQKERVKSVLADMPQYAEQYVLAQQLLVELAETDAAKLDILGNLEKTHPDRASVLAQKMQILLRAGRTKEALGAFQTFVSKQPKSARVPRSVVPFALEAMLGGGDRAGAVGLCERMFEQTRRRRWRKLAILLMARGDTDKALSMLPEPPEADWQDAALGVCVAVQKGDLAAAKAWHARMTQIDELMKRQKRSVPGTYKILMALATAQQERAEAELAQFGGGGGISKSIAQKLLSSSPSNPDSSSQAGELLRASLAIDLGVGTVAEGLAMSLLKSRPECEWAAAVVVRTQATSQTAPSASAVLRKVLEILRPSDCVLARMIQAALMMEKKQYEQAARLYGQAAEVEKANAEILLRQGLALEKAGQLEQAMEAYRRAWELTKSPVAANSGAYTLTQLWPKDRAKLQQAQSWAEAAVAANPRSPEFRDTKGWVAHLLGDQQLAGRELRRAVKGLPDNPEVHYHLGEAEAALRRNELARWHLAAAVSIGDKLAAENKEIAPTQKEAIRLAREALGRLGESGP